MIYFIRVSLEPDSSFLKGPPCKIDTDSVLSSLLLKDPGDSLNSVYEGCSC